MRLNSIKLSGFKSFADAVTLGLPGQLVGVVGPNGCGKSNIMDAVRWVLGESRASELRGQLMQDVIFNGTTERKPASRSLVELNFDNGDHRAGGAFGRFAEIAVRRVLTRDGASSYFINGQRVRRRDVHDVFMGTGLGPRAYAIIGQGTIGRIIESRPEELRLFLEEAAGVSKYKERRRETQNRLSDTRENLTRLEDILRELRSALAKLERQAKVADQYRRLQEAVAQAQNQLWFSRREQAQEQRRQLRAQLTEAETELQAVTAALGEQEAALETRRQEHGGAGDAVGQAQAKLYEATAEVGQLEAQIRFVAEGRKRVREQLAQLQEQQAHWQGRHDAARQDQQALQQKQQQVQAELQAQDGRIAAGASRLASERVALQKAQHEAQQARAQVAALSQRHQVTAAEQRSVSAQLQQLQARRDKLLAAQAQLPQADEARLQQLQARKQAADAADAAARQQVQQLQEQAQELEQARAAAQRAASQQASRASEVAARLRALQDLQHKVQSRSALQPWRQKHGLDRAQPLWTLLQVDAGWERALEAALRERLGALPVPSMEQVAPLAADAPPARLTLYVKPEVGVADAPGALPRLVDALDVADTGLRALLADWLAGCLMAPTLDAALQGRESLQPGQAIYTPDGHSVHAAGVSFHADDTEQSGLLARAAEIQALDQQLQAQQQRSEHAAGELQRAESAADDCTRQLAEARRAADAARASAHRLQVEHLRGTQEAQQLRERRARLREDLAEVEATQAELQQRDAQSGQDVAALREQEQAARAQQRDREQQEQAARRQLGATRDAHNQLQQRRQELDFERRSLQARDAELGRALATASEQGAHIRQQQETAALELAQLGDAPADARLQQALESKRACEQALAQARSRYEELSRQLRAADEQRLALQQRQEPLRARITDLRLQEQAAAMRVEEAEQRLHEAGADLQALAAAADGVPLDAAQLQGEIESKQRKMQSLGAVNLAALDELQAQRERKALLDAQAADLIEAMQTLEAAIKKIDGETRALLGSTFDAVNGHFGRMFPELFGGGRAQLVMTGEEILDAGVEVMAQPPGKKNQTIHLLSGGEKALTAIALVFAIFQLNPAPFCLLDEVDAPLDDANTGRFARLVQRMSAQGTQFLFISHNKIAMEMAEQLIGVTMQEKGVSRIVAVDVQSAVRMTKAA